MLLKLSDVIKLLGNYRIFQYILFGDKVVPSWIYKILKENALSACLFILSICLFIFFGLFIYSFVYFVCWQFPFIFLFIFSVCLITPSFVYIQSVCIKFSDIFLI